LKRTTASVSLLVTHSREYVERHPGLALRRPPAASRAIAGYAIDGVIVLFVAVGDSEVLGELLTARIALTSYRGSMPNAASY
jgi:hypothetical protein